VIDANLAPVQFDPDMARAWLAFWAQVPHLPALQRVQIAVQRRVLSNLRYALAPLISRDQAHTLAAMIAAMIDGVWLRAALSNWHEVDSSGSRALLADFVDSQLRQGGIENVALRKDRKRRQATIQTFNPATGELLAVVPVSGPEEVDAAVARASAAQTVWAAMTGTERGRVLRRAADILRSRNDELARLETQDTGKPIQETQVVDVVSGADCLEYFGGLAATIAGEHLDLGPSAFGYTRREPLGVVAGIGAWNYPLQIACWKCAPALACGNAMIFKPAELTPLTAQHLAEALLQAGAPEGIFQVVQGHAETGQLLSRHPGIRKVSVTGAVSTGCAVMRDSSDTLKQITLELGGKSPIVVFADADLDNAVAGALLGNFYSAGEVCSNGTRVFVERAVLDRFVEKLILRTRALRIGDPLDPQTQVGTLISRDHMEKVLSYIKAGEVGGARLLIGGRRRTEGALAKGFYVEPAVFDRCTDEMRIVREEIFGPVMCVLAFDDEADVVRRANATEFGLSAGVFTSDLTRAHRVIAQLQAGTCWINHYNITPIELPFGGVKMSGLGRENGRAAIEHYTQLKSVYVAMQDVQSPY
jgi:betaine-aldehyde dehydrogenase